MKSSNFWFLTLCTLLVIASVNGWNLYLKIAVIANAIVVLLDVIKRTKKLKKG